MTEEFWELTEEKLDTCHVYNFNFSDRAAYEGHGFNYIFKIDI